jgi:formylglycine-generating enzyme required for sulfatase activity
MSTRSDEHSLRIYCPAHRVHFQVLRASTIPCESPEHTLADDFPYSEFWEYCCDCRTYWPSDVIKGATARERCPSCERQAARRFLCAECKVLSFESDDPGKGKEFSIPAGQAISPVCPACLKPAGSGAVQHQCAHISSEFVTARRVCPLCEEVVRKSADAPVVMVAAESPRCLKCGASSQAGERFCGQCGASMQVGDSRRSVKAGGKIETHPSPQAASVSVAEQAAGTQTSDQQWQPKAFKRSQDNSSVGRADDAPVTAKEAWHDETAKKHAKTNLLIGVALIVVLAGALAVGWWARRPGTEPPPEGGGQPPSGGVETAAVPPRMAYVAGGEFMMGNASGDEYERPPHKVAVKAFYIDQYEVTCEEYAHFVKATGRTPPPGWRNGQYPAGAAQQPVTGVNWDDANAYAKWAGKRLPTEEEWEFAARGTDGRLYPWGQEWKVGMANASGASGGGLADVGTFKGLSPSGAYDMVGNAWEWTASDLKPYPGGQLLEQEPRGLKVIRGGYWGSRITKATTTFRRGWPANGGDDYANTGFRCVR